MRRKRLGAAILLSAVLFVVGSAYASDIPVPDRWPTIQQAVDSAGVSDRVVVTRTGTYDPFLLYKGITVTKADTVSGAVTVSGSGHYYAARISYDAGADARIEGLTLTGGSEEILLAESGTVNGCVIDAQGTAYPYGAVRIGNTANYTTAHLTNCTLDFSVEDGDGIFVVYAGQYAGDVVISGNVIAADGGTGNAGYAIYVDEGSSVIEGNTIEFTGDKIATGIPTPSGYLATISENTIRNALQGIYVDSYGQDDNAAISYNLLVDCTRGINLGHGTAGHNTVVLTEPDDCQGVETEGVHSVYGTLSNNLMVNMGLGLYCAGGTTLSHNVFWSDDPCGEADNCSASASEVNVLEPLFCGSREGTGEYTQRMDSGAAPGNNGWDELVGAYDVECAWGELARTTTVPEDATVTVLEDVTVPDGLTLTLEPRAGLRFDDDDESNGGNDVLENELIVDDGGTLTIAGTSGNLVTLTSSAETPGEGDWWGVRVEEGGTADMEYASVTYSQYGVDYTSTTAGGVSHSSFSNNEIADIWAGAGNHTMSATIDHNSITVGGGCGILLESFLGGLTVEANTITGNAQSAAGIKFWTFSDGEDPLVTGNTISGVSTGSGIYLLAAEPTVTENSISGCKWGLYATGGAASIGLASEASSGNFIMNNTTSGITGYGGSPVVRYNSITGNEYGVIAMAGGDPDLGTGAAHKGNNVITGSGTYCIWNRNSSGTVDAQGNYFGACNPGPPMCWFGNVDTGNYLCSSPLSIGVDAAIGEAPGEVTQPVVHGLYPNPMRGPARIAFSLPNGADRVNIRVYDLAGRVVRDFGDLVGRSGAQEVLWDGRDNLGGPVSNGIYFIKVAVGDRPAGAVKALVVR